MFLCTILENLEPVISALLTVVNAHQQHRMTWNEYQHSLNGKGYSSTKRADLYKSYKANWDGRMDEYTYN